jgi:hypothetical protein
LNGVVLMVVWKLLLYENSSSGKWVSHEFSKIYHTCAEHVSSVGIVLSLCLDHTF